MKLAFLIVTIGASMVAATAGPVTLSWSAQDTGGALCLTNATPLPANSTVRLGYFDLADTDLEPLFPDPLTLDAHFTVLATAQVGSFEGQSFIGAPELNTAGINHAAPGCFASSVVFTPAADPVVLNGKRCFVWAMNGATVSEATHHGIFSHHAWILNSNHFGVLAWDLSQVSNTDPRDIILGHRGPQISPVVGGTVLRLTNTTQLRQDVADDDEDGTPNLLETAFAMDQAIADSQKLPKIATQAGRPVLSFTRKAGGTSSSDGTYTAEGLRYAIELSADLKTWAPCEAAAQAQLETKPGPVEGTEEVSLAFTPANLLVGCQFARVRVERVQ